MDLMEPNEGFVNAIRSRKFSWVYILAIMSFTLIAAVVILGINSKNANKTNATATPTVVNFDPGTGFSYVPGYNNFKIYELAIGTGKQAVNGSTVTVQYTGTFENGKEFFSSYRYSGPFTFTLGNGDVIQGWELGIPGMRERGKRRLIVPPELAYGEEGVPGDIPPNSTLIYDIELLEVK